ncbi:PucR family transcriptional regulator [Citricoccus sp.]|uniref:PucR family transcriptional regulator n=1 Tax=Citricoccus sp. TaxID=1978372 RepID=UPI0028BF3E9E|nr:PucR family transcriptional regulator [Citricoccus sp.]
MISVAQVLGLHGLGLRPVVSGDTSLPVSWVATSELVDPTLYLNGGEIILSTGLRGPSARRDWEEYVQRLVDRGVVALGLGVGDLLTWNRVPEDLATAAHGAGLTLFEVPERTPFLRIIQEVAGLRAAEERTALEATLTHQRALTRAATALDGSLQVLRSLATLIPGAWAAMCTADGEIQESSAVNAPAVPSDRSLEQMIGRLRSAGLRGSLSESGPRGSIVVHPLGVHGDPQSYLVVVLTGPVERLHAATITTAVALLSLHAERTAEQRLSRRRIRAGALALLLGGDVRASDALLAVAGDAPWGGTVRRVRAGRLRGKAERLQMALRRLEDHEDRTGHRILTGTLAPADAEGSGEMDTAVLFQDAHTTLAALRRIVEVADLRAGIGGSSSLDDAATSHGQAIDTLHRTAARQRIGTWDDVVAGGVAGLLPPGAARAWAHELLEPLSSQGPAGTRLLRTLRVFLTHNGNRRQTAEDLGVHRNTLLHQLQLIEKAYGRSLDDPQWRADLWIALHLPGN